nr:hypothetical protein [uncultured Albidiferax sp.]
MTDTTPTPDVRPAVGPHAMAYALHPAIIVNPQATEKDLLSWCLAELRNLHTWTDILVCSRSDCQMDPCELAGAVNERLEPLLRVFEAAMELPQAK